MAINEQGANPQLDADTWKLDCAHLTYSGRPIFFGSPTGVRAGISTRKATVGFGEPVKVDLWVDNRSDKPVWFGGNCLPYWHGGDVFNSTGQRLISIHEQMEVDAKKKGQTTVEVCTLSAPIFMIPPHTCRTAVEAGGDNLVLDYQLAPGLYYVFPIHDIDPALFKQGLMIAVREP